MLANQLFMGTIALPLWTIASLVVNYCASSRDPFYSDPNIPPIKDRGAVTSITILLLLLLLLLFIYCLARCFDSWGQWRWLWQGNVKTDCWINCFPPYGLVASGMPNGSLDAQIASDFNPLEIWSRRDFSCDFHANFSKRFRCDSAAILRSALRFQIRRSYCAIWNCRDYAIWASRALPVQAKSVLPHYDCLCFPVFGTRSIP